MRRSLVAVLVAALAASCGDGGPSTTPRSPSPLSPLAWTNTPSRLTLRVGAAHDIRMTLSAPVDARYSVRTSNSRVEITDHALRGGIFTATIRGVASGRDTVEVTANARGYKSATTSFSVTVEERTPPPPTGLKVAELTTNEEGYTWITWTWDPVPGIEEYLVGLRYDEEETEYVFHVSEPTFTTPGLSPVHVAHLRVATFREGLAGPWSEPVTGRASSVTPPTIFQDPRFDRSFWRELVFDAYDCPETAGGRHHTNAPAGCSYVAATGLVPHVEERSIYVLDTTSPDFYIRTHDDAGDPTFSRSEITEMRRLIPRTMQALTGDPYVGQIVEGKEDRDQEEWITVVEVPADAERFKNVCGRARLGFLPGRIWLVEGCQTFGATFVHEIGHAMGFSHVSNQCDAMFSGGSCNATWFSSREIWHARLAYELGRFHPYIDDRSQTMTKTTALPMPEPLVIECPGPH